MEVDSGTDALGIEKKMEENKRLICETVSKDKDGEEVPDQEEEVTSLKTLTAGHHALQFKLQHATLELALKENRYKDLEAELSHQKEKTRLVKERIHRISEKLFAAQTVVEEKHKHQEQILTEIFDLNWRLLEGKKFLDKLRIKEREIKLRMAKRKEELTRSDDIDGSRAAQRKQVKDNILKFQTYKMRLENGDPQLLSVLNGNKLFEVEHRKQGYHNAIEDLNLRMEALYVDIDEKKDHIEKLKTSLDTMKDKYSLKIRQLTSKLNCLRETELRIKRTCDYLRQKIDYGMYVPSPPPWPISRKPVL